MSTLLLAKLLLAPALVVLTSLAGRRWGAHVTGLLAGLPIVAGPILLILALADGATFASDAASAALFGLVGIVAFAVGFERAAVRQPWPTALLVGWLCFAAAALPLGLALADVLSDPVARFGCALAAFALGAVCVRPSALARAQLARPTIAWDLPARAIATAALVITVSGLSTLVGATFSGILALFPIATSVLAAFTLAQQGYEQTALLLRGILLGGLGFSAFCLIVSELIVRTGTAATFLVAICGALAGQALIHGATGVRAAKRGR